jgi:hypothetical protein
MFPGMTGRERPQREENSRLRRLRVARRTPGDERPEAMSRERLIARMDMLDESK